MSELEAMTEGDNIDIIALTETLPKSYSKYTKPKDLNFNLKGYTTIHCFKGRGLCICIKDSITFDRISSYEDMYDTSIFIKIKTSEDNLTLGLIYRSLTSREEENGKLLSLVDHVAHEHNSYTKKLLLLCDFNFPGIDWPTEECCHNESHIESTFLTCFHEHFLFQHVNKPTHCRGDQSETLIDLIISNNPNLVS